MKEIKIAALGDSITKGVVLNKENNYSVLEDSFIGLLRERVGIEIDNYGKFGCTISYAHHFVDRHPEEIASAKYTLLEYGGNDCDFYWKRIALDPNGDHHPKTSLEAFGESFIGLIEKVRSLGSTPLILSLPPIDSEAYFNFFSKDMSNEQKANILGWMGGEKGAIARWHDSYNNLLFDIAEKTSTPIINITHSFDNYSGDWRALICADGIHPNSEGHRLIASSILDSADSRIAPIFSC
jgi:lysophospholipase L1-like esterase